RLQLQVPFGQHLLGGHEEEAVAGHGRIQRHVREDTTLSDQLDTKSPDCYACLVRGKLLIFTAFLCARSARAASNCPHAFSYRGGGSEHPVAVKGSFDSWGAGIALSYDGTDRQATAMLPAATRITYKFYIGYNDSSSAWIADPNDPLQESDG